MSAVIELHEDYVDLAADWTSTDAEVRKRGEQTGFIVTGKQQLS